MIIITIHHPPSNIKILRNKVLRGTDLYDNSIMCDIKIFFRTKLKKPIMPLKFTRKQIISPINL